ncbi:hypothetical protein [Paenibacillus bouchesdurhonensis]|uniref:hypothetical protein n=1 Tax=Paenibacillus bouchesdurhonensis TaxID=1870990 RepID=UPI000DA5EDA6|nr:hypothetical protein [Paenibacillus bouchesdurhonensis]
MRKIKIKGCDAFIIREDLAVLIDIEAECAVIYRLCDDRIDPDGLCLESPISLKALQKIYTADDELDVLIAALEG